MTRLAALAISLTLLAAPVAAQTKSTIQKLNDEWTTAFNKGDSHALAELYTEDAYVLPAGAEMVHGRQAVQGFWDKAMTQLGDGRLTTVDVQSLGPDAAREIGTFRFMTKGNQPEEISGKYVVVWRKAGGRWKLAADIWNMNK
jgi:uncharacterized protein (TIGR02246 family)